MRWLLAFLLLGCGSGVVDRKAVLSPENFAFIQEKAEQTAKWSTWCEDFPSNENCADGDSMAGSLGFLCAVGFEPSCYGVARSVRDGKLYRSPVNIQTDNTSSQAYQMLFTACHVTDETRMLDGNRCI